ncbi:hypothetical protein GGI05_005475, partial [Coemansia sp. RSA 2603]
RTLRSRGLRISSARRVVVASRASCRSGSPGGSSRMLMLTRASRIGALLTSIGLSVKTPLVWCATMARRLLLRGPTLRIFS